MYSPFLKPLHEGAGNANSNHALMMKNQLRLEDIWLKAAALGCLWASSEIVLGGFLHNLRIPMAGNIMAGIGIILMIAIGHLWPERGLFWRAGLICALMRSLAPGAVIFGPMAAITCQACLMELAVRIIGRNRPGWIAGAMLAMTWNVFQFVLNNLLYYGQGVVEIYLGLIRWCQKNLDFSTGPNWMPALLILVVHLAAGLGAGLLGLFIGRKAAGEPLPMQSLTTARVMQIRSALPARSFPHSLPWLVAMVIMLVTVLILTGLAPWWGWLPAGLLALAIWIPRYRQAVRPLLRPGFWFWFVLLTLLSGVLFSSLRGDGNGILPGIGFGLAMNFRAAVLVVGFSALGTELRSPRLGWRLSRGRFRQLPAALEAAVETLPLVMANLPRLEEVFRHPVAVFHRVVAQADFWLKRLTLRQHRRAGVMLLCGSIGEGKTRALGAMIKELRAGGRRMAGILSPAVHRGVQRIGYDLVNMATGLRTPLSRVERQTGMPSVGNYTFLPAGLEAGRRALSLQVVTGADVVVVDEVGPWELCDQGWAEALYELTLCTTIPMIWVVRDDIVDQVRDHWGLQDPLIASLTLHTGESLNSQVRIWLESLSSQSEQDHEAALVNSRKTTR